MIRFTTVEEVRAYTAQWRRSNPEGSVALVPTMGFLHAGHASLMRRAREECGLVVLSIFVNPLQFGPNEDFERYPRDEERDVRLAAEQGVDAVFLPSVAEMYPRPSATRVLVAGVTDRLCGASRPGHFDGVGTVVSKLFHIVQPDRAYFGLKDAQQVAVIERMTEDLHFPVAIVPCPTVREPDGLALSSRNVYLSPEERKQAVVLSQALSEAEAWLHEPGMTSPELERRVRETIGRAPLADIDYVEVLSFPELSPPEPSAPLERAADRLIVALAVRFGGTRLIDNRLFSMSEVISHA